MFDALMCLFTICTKYNAPLASVNGDSDDDRYDIVGCGAAGEPVAAPLRSATGLEEGMCVCCTCMKRKCASLLSAPSIMHHWRRSMGIVTTMDTI